jgi:exosortase/archaeosortase family protein
MSVRLPPQAAFLAGILLTGYGLLVVLGVLPHDALLAGLAALLLGVGVLAFAARRDAASAALPAPPIGRRGLAVALLGAAAAVGVVAYNLAIHSDLSLPEWGILAYGIALVAAAFRLDRRVAGVPVATLVGWSFPLLLAPFALYAMNAILADRTPAPAAPIIAMGLVQPLALLLGLLGDKAQVAGVNLVLPTPRGPLSIGVGLVCAGLYPMVLFMGVLGLHGWQRQLPPKRLAGYLGLGLGGLYAANLLRMLIVAKVGQAWGADALQEAHANLGWALFVGFMLLFWGVVLRRLEPAQPTASGEEEVTGPRPPRGPARDPS